jgi:hypothetical protein
MVAARWRAAMKWQSSRLTRGGALEVLDLVGSPLHQIALLVDLLVITDRGRFS